MSLRDYTSFASVAKSKFRQVASELGYEQLSGIFYVKKVAGWYLSFNLQAAAHGNDFFYVNYGIVATDLCPATKPYPVAECGMLLGNRLTDINNTGAFGRESKLSIEESASRVLAQYKKYALPWIENLNSWPAIAAEYLRINPIQEEMLGQHTGIYGADLRSATYGYLLLKCGRNADALRWLHEAERILSLPVYFTRDGRMVHTKEKFARLQKPEPYQIETLDQVKQTIELITKPA